jgi:hypothetical protein
MESCKFTWQISSPSGPGSSVGRAEYLFWGKRGGRGRAWVTAAGKVRLRANEWAAGLTILSIDRPRFRTRQCGSSPGFRPTTPRRRAQSSGCQSYGLRVPLDGQGCRTHKDMYLVDGSKIPPRTRLSAPDHRSAVFAKTVQARRLSQHAGRGWDSARVLVNDCPGLVFDQQETVQFR